MHTFSTNWIALQQSDRWMVIECWTWKAQILTGSQREVLKSHMSKKKRPWFLFFFFFHHLFFYSLVTFSVQPPTSCFKLPYQCLYFFFWFSISSAVTPGNCCHGSSRAGTAEQSGGGGSVSGGPRQAAAPRRVRVRTSAGHLLFSTRRHDPAHPYTQLPVGWRSAHAHSGYGQYMVYKTHTDWPPHWLHLRPIYLSLWFKSVISRLEHSSYFMSHQETEYILRCLPTRKLFF